jgi:hypothetical protein
MAITTKVKSTPATKKAATVTKKMPTTLKTNLVKTPVAKKPAQKAIAKATAIPKVAPLKIARTTDVSSLSIKPIKAKKIKLVRDSFTIPKPEYLILDNLKLRAADLKYSVKKGELLRAGIKALAAMTDADFLSALKMVPILKSGRPSK